MFARSSAHARSLVVALAAGSLAACHREERATPPDAAPVASAPDGPFAADTAADAANAPASYADRVRAWNDALDRKDVAALGAMYAANVRFYGKSTPRAAVLAAKAGYFSKHPDFRQTIGQVTTNGARATFSKFVTVGGRKGRFAAYLVFGRSDAAGGITVEGDETTDKNHHADPCEDAVAEIIAKRQSEVVASCLRDVSAAKRDDVGCGGMTLPPEASGKLWTFEVFENHPDHMVARAFFEVDLARRTVKDAHDLTAGGDGTPLPFDPHLMDAAVDACAGVAAPPP